MKRFLTIPDRNDLAGSLSLAEKYGAGFEYNDFFNPNILDNDEAAAHIISEYKKLPLPEYCTLHGAFFDVTVFSPDRKIREISDLRVRQSIDAAVKLGTKAVVFHTNYNPFLNSRNYINGWIDENVSYWSGILEKKPQINIYFENMFDTSPDIIAELACRLESFPNFGICFDYAHAALSDVPHKEWTEKLGKFVKHIHINDNDLKSDLHLAVGDGKIDWEEFYRLYEKFMNGATVLIETSLRENQEKSLKKLAADGFLKVE